MSLGKGLGALITSTAGSTRKRTILSTGDGTSQTQKIWTVPVTEIKPNPKQPRRQFKDSELKELAESIKEHGILQPLLVAEQANGGYEIIAGERRWRASQLAGLTSVPVIVKELAPEQQLEVSLIENIQRENLNPIEEAFAYKRLIEEFGLTQAAVAEKVGKSRPAVANAIRLLELPTPIQAALVEGTINTGQARALLSLSSEKEQLDMLASMHGQKITVRELERTAATTAPDRHARRDPNLLYLEGQLRAALGTKVSIAERAGKGAITINYFSSDELKRLIKKIIP